MASQARILNVVCTSHVYRTITSSILFVSSFLYLYTTRIFFNLFLPLTFQGNWKSIDPTNVSYVIFISEKKPYSCTVAYVRVGFFLYLLQVWDSVLQEGLETNTSLGTTAFMSPRLLMEELHKKMGGCRLEIDFLW